MGNILFYIEIFFCWILIHSGILLIGAYSWVGQTLKDMADMKDGQLFALKISRELEGLATGSTNCGKGMKW